MNGWVLTSVVCEPPDRYFSDITPLTFPIMAAYAELHNMAWEPKIITRAEYGDFAGKGPAPHGTASVYASIPHRRRLLDRYEGVVFMDSDTVIMRADVDICKAVTPQQPISTEPACNCATMVLLSCDKTKEMLNYIWDMRHGAKHRQWLEQSVYMELMGFDPNYPGDNLPPRWIGETEWTPLRKDLDPRWNMSPFWPVEDPLSFHPSGVQPFEHRIAMVARYSQESGVRDTLLNTTTGEKPK